MVPDFTAETTAGESFVLSEQREKVVLLNFRATWCGPCVRELPAFDRLYKEYEQEIAEKYPADGIPHTLVIGKDGIAKKIYPRVSDADEQYEEYKNAIVSAVFSNLAQNREI